MVRGLGRGVTGGSNTEKDEKENGRLTGRAEGRNKRDGERRSCSGGGFL